MLEKGKKYKSNLGEVEIVATDIDDPNYPFLGVVRNSGISAPVLLDHNGESPEGIISLIKKEKKSLKNFLESEGISWEKFLKNCQPENQRWNDSKLYYNDIEDLEEKGIEKWLTNAFFWPINELDLNLLEMIQLDILWKRYREKYQKVTFQ